MVLDAGKIAEYDSPQTLLQNPESIFYGMAKDAGLVWWRQVCVWPMGTGDLPRSQVKDHNL